MYELFVVCLRLFALIVASGLCVCGILQPFKKERERKT